MIQNELKLELHSSIKPIKERRLSNASTFCSSKEKESEEFNSDNTNKFLFSSRRNSKSYLKINIKRKNANFFDLDITPKTRFKSKDDKSIKSKKKKIKEEKQNKTKNITVIEKPKVSNIKNLNISSTKNVIRRNILDLYTQNFDLTCMKKQPPKLPEIFEHEHNISNKNIFMNESYGQIHKGSIGNIFYNHLMTFNYKKKKLIKTCLTQRNQKKLLTIIYYKSTE